MQVKRILKKLNVFLGKPFFWAALLFLVTSVIFIPALKMKFWWVDDGWTITMARKIIDSVTHFNFEGLKIIIDESGGRFRVVYWIFQTFVYLVSGNNPTLHFLVHYLVILLSAYLIFRIVLLITKSNLSGFVSSIIYVLSPINTENLYRLGPQEPILCLFLIASIYFLFRRKIFLSILFLLFTALTKENGFILWIPIFFLYVGKRVLFKRRDLDLEKYCIWGFMFSIPLILNTFLRHGGYSGFYTFNINQIISNFGSYIRLVNEALSPLFVLFVTTYSARVVIYFRNNNFKKYRLGLLLQAMFLILFLSFIAVQSPWEFVLYRYIMPASVGLVIFMGLEIAGIREMFLIKKIRLTPWLVAIFTVYFFTFIWMNMIHIYLSGELSAHQTSFIQSLYKDLANEVPPNGVVLLNFLKGDSTTELVAQTGMQLGLFYQRPDIQVSYLSLDNLPKEDFIIVGTPQIRAEYPREVVEKSIGKYRKDESLIQEDKFLVLTTPMGLFKQVTKKTYQFIIHKKPLTGDGIFTYYVSRDYWYKYYVGK
jgi:hypothetical protein